MLCMFRHWAKGHRAIFAFQTTNAFWAAASVADPGFTSNSQRGRFLEFVLCQQKITLTRPFPIKIRHLMQKGQIVFGALGSHIRDV